VKHHIYPFHGLLENGKVVKVAFDGCERLAFEPLFVRSDQAADLMSFLMKETVDQVTSDKSRAAGNKGFHEKLGIF
jgi:hypothetical protein